MKNILFIHSSSELYGSDRSLLNIVKNVDKQKYNVTVVFPCSGPLGKEMEKIPGVRIEIFAVAVLRRKNLSFKGGVEYYKDFRQSIKYLKELIIKNDIQIVDTNTAVVFPGAIAAKKCHVKSVWHIREIIKSNLENEVISFIMNRYADIIVANSKATGDRLKVNKNKIRIVHNAVDEIKNSDTIPHSSVIIGMAGRINRWKGQKLFIEAAEIVHEELPDVEFEIAGEAYSGEEYIKEELIQFIEQKRLTGTVHLLGQVNNMSEFYKGLDIFVLPSIQPEPFGLVVIEAMEYSIPVVATNHGGPMEIITEGKDGYLVDYTSPNELADRLIELVKDTDKRKQMGKNAKQSKRNRFSISAMVNSIEIIFEELTPGKNT